ncbi:probable beta-1,4-xylosyltransferase IRX9H [Diospyros lotus]|uniref:probable beta-1,4-xylosyltransferase IRX9H n=1 Tax=Diospyros lotus TaxID=55363 RepID=UPI00225AF451|nr:probable beta-1,4-xylosyltransferase IRX9H [Diospyros lotus]XP_052210724.1 probable beta-1,4-xylosyltransferase IRX9H [Diospyros lotus]XP_052210725.1 probable beta-1,4-xylosyltransferase IRX9H [Diospyros lotus]
MASIRRAQSPVPRPGSLRNADANLVASPLSKSSSCSQNHPAPVGSLTSSFSSLGHALYRAQAFILGLCSRRFSRPIERSKPKAQVWRRSLVPFFICFMVGVLFGLTPFASMNLSVNFMSKQQAFSFEMVPPQKVESLNVNSRNATLVLDDLAVNHIFSVDPDVMQLDLQNQTFNGSLVMQSLNQDLVMAFNKLLIIVTPTYAQPFQAYHLNRLAHALKLVPPPLLWIVVEMGSQSAETADILRRNGVMYRHLVLNKNLTDIKYRGVHQRNVALSHIETHHLDGIVYFADGDNIYSVEIFEQMRHIRRFGTWMVVKPMKSNSRTILEGPICNGTQVVGWHTNEPRRFQRFYADISGFAFNSTILWDPKRWHRPTLEPIRQLDTVDRGLQVSLFIEQVVEDESQMECLPEESSRIMVWHLHDELSHLYPPEWSMKNDNLYVTAPLD